MYMMDVMDSHGVTIAYAAFLKWSADWGGKHGVRLVIRKGDKGGIGE